MKKTKILIIIFLSLPLILPILYLARNKKTSFYEHHICKANIISTNSGSTLSAHIVFSIDEGESVIILTGFMLDNTNNSHSVNISLNSYSRKTKFGYELKNSRANTNITKKNEQDTLKKLLPDFFFSSGITAAFVLGDGINNSIFYIYGLPFFRC